MDYRGLKCFYALLMQIENFILFGFNSPPLAACSKLAG